MAKAQTGIKVWPTSVELTIKSGEQAVKAINVQNQGNELIRVRAYATDFSIDKDSNFVFSEPGHESYSASKWLSINGGDFGLSPGENRGIEVTVSAPTEVEPGGHYSALFFEAIPLENQGVVSISTRIPTFFYITIPGVTEVDVFANADIISLLLPGFAERGPVEMGVTVRNTGNVHLTVAAKAYFSASWGKNSELDLGQAVILPNSEVVIKGNWREVPLFGRVRANIVIGYFNQEGELINKSKSAEFWAAPWKLVGVVVIALCSLILVIVILSKRFRLRLERK